jgi:hypothetical protein
VVVGGGNVLKSVAITSLPSAGSPDSDEEPQAAIPHETSPVTAAMATSLDLTVANVLGVHVAIPSTDRHRPVRNARR